MGSKQYDSIQTKNKYGTYIALDANHSDDISIPVNDKFKREFDVLDQKEETKE